MSDTSDDMEAYSLGWCEEDEKNLERQLKLAIWALKKINTIELNSQRPGGGYTESARISYWALKKLEDL